MDVIKKLSLATGESESEIKKKVLEKKEELSGMISDEGAAYMVAKELGIEFSRPTLKLADIKPGTKNLEIIGKIKKIFTRDYQSEKGSGKLSNVILEDETGSITLTLWNEELDVLEHIAEGDTIKIRGYSPKGSPAKLALGNYGHIEASDVEISIPSTQRTKIALLASGAAEIRAVIVHLFESDLFYEVCPHCNKRIKDGKCEEHGPMEPDYNIVLTGIADDGTGNIRVVLFGSQAEAVLGMSKKELKQRLSSSSLSSLFKEILGKEFIFSGAVRQNKIFDRPEFVTNNVKSIDVIKEIELLLGE